MSLTYCENLCLGAPLLEIRLFSICVSLLREVDGAVAVQITPLPGGWPLKPGSATLPFFGVQVHCSCLQLQSILQYSFVPKSMYYNLSVCMLKVQSKCLALS
jgi:hypothetical protein